MTRSKIPASITDAKPIPYWLDVADAPAVRPPLTTDADCDLLVVGGGLTGLWSALLAKQEDPDREIVVLERTTVPGGASGRNGGMLLGSFVDERKLSSFPEQEAGLLAMGRDNRAEIERTIERYAIDCDYENRGLLLTATTPAQVERARAIHAAAVASGRRSTFHDADALAERLRGVGLLAGVEQPDSSAMANPAKLARGLARVCEQLGVRIHEQTPVSALEDRPEALTAVTPRARIRARQVVLATYAAPSLVPRHVEPWRILVSSRILMTEPLRRDQLAAIGWDGRQCVIDLDTHYYYYRLTADDRILWGFGDAALQRKGVAHDEMASDLETYARMAGDFRARFPALAAVAFSHRWGGVVDTGSRAAPFFGTTHDGRVAYVHGYAGGAAASRGGAVVMLDLLARRTGSYSSLPIVAGGQHGRPGLRRYPPQRLLSLGMRLVARAADSSERRGRRHWLLRLLGRLGYAV